ncbi:small nuclear ribonucleoprotein [Paramyrothecium foliicola]|nr:small nuclear ribonucleoprotein [Paramyrothecium foliicola]
MPKFFCTTRPSQSKRRCPGHDATVELTMGFSPVSIGDYCDVYLTHDSMSVRKAHNSGRNHLRNVVDYYQQIGHEKAQSVIDSITSSYAAEGQAHANPMLPQNQPGHGFPPPPFGFPGGVPPPFPGMPGAPPGQFPHGLPPPPGGRGMPPMPPFPPGANGMPPIPPNGLPFPPPGGLPFPPPGPGGLPPPNFPGMPGMPPPGQQGSFPPGSAPPPGFPPPGMGPPGQDRR